MTAPRRCWICGAAMIGKLCPYCTPVGDVETQRQTKNEREMAEGARCSGLCKDGGQCNC